MRTVLRTGIGDRVGVLGQPAEILPTPSTPSDTTRIVVMSRPAVTSDNATRR